MRNKVKVYRKAANLTQEEFALKLSVTRQTINAIENNKYNPTLELAIRMAKFLGVPVEELFLLE